MQMFLLFLLGTAILAMPIYLLSGLFGPRQPEDVNPNAPEPTEEEFSTPE